LLTANDLAQLRQIPVNPRDDSQQLLGVLANQIDQAAVGIKMDELALGEELFKMSRTNNAGRFDQPLSRALDENKCTRYGQMAYYDLLTKNYDRFLQNGHIGNNLDFDANYNEAVPLDNIYFSTSLVNNNWQNELSEMDIIKKSNRLNYAAIALTDIKNASGINMDRATFETRVVAMKRGIDDAEHRALNTIRIWKRASAGRRIGIAGPTDRQKTQQVLVARYERCLGSSI
ncbi:MAG: hypothetical protein AAF152_04980, partial [Cyanobacteria bacterium P01_A01_bin.114]